MSENRPLLVANVTYSEDDTFRKLSRAPYDAADRAWLQVFRDGFSVEEANKVLRVIGWTEDEYYRAYHKFGNYRG